MEFSIIKQYETKNGEDWIKVYVTVGEDTWYAAIREKEVKTKELVGRLLVMLGSSISNA